MRFTIGSPSPMPRGFVVQKGEKILSLSSGEIPLPLSRTVTTTALAWFPSRTGFALRVIRGFSRPESASAALATRCSNASSSAVSFLHAGVAEFLASIGVFDLLRPQEGKSLEGHEWIAHLLRHTAGELGTACGSVK